MWKDWRIKEDEFREKKTLSNEFKLVSYVLFVPLPILFVLDIRFVCLVQWGLKRLSL